MAAGPRLEIVRRWWWLVLAGAALGVGAAFVAVRSMPPVYRATSTLLVTPPNDASLNQSFARTYARMAVHPVVLDGVRARLELQIPPGRLESMVTAQPVPDTQLIEIVVQFGDAAGARDIANATAQSFIDQQAALLPIGLAGPSLRIGQPAIAPDQPIGPRQLPALILGVLVGILVGLGVAGLMDMPRAASSLPDELPTRRAASDPIRAILFRPTRAPTQAVNEPVGTPDILRGLTAVFVAALVLAVPLVATGGLRDAGPRSSSPPSQQAGATRRVAAVPPAVLPIAQVAPVTDLPASAPPSLLVPEIPTAAPAAEIAGATSATALQSRIDASREQAVAVAAASAAGPPPQGPSQAQATRTPEIEDAVEPPEPGIQAGTTRAPQGFTSAFLREEPTTSAHALASLPNGTRLEVFPDTASGDGFTWLRVRTADGMLGWIVSTAVANL